FEKSSRQNWRQQQHQGSQRVDLLNDRMWQWPDEQPNPMDVEKEIDRVLYLHYYVLIQQDAPTNFDIFIKDTERRVPCQPTREDPDPPTFGEFGLWNGAELVVYDSDYGKQ
ncbi:hypothetical protein MRX96_048291, partial [Rhipicephalus microplus]